MDGMENERIADLVARKIFNIAKTDTDFAIQLLVWKLLMPKDRTSYSLPDIKKFILDALSKNVTK